MFWEDDETKTVCKSRPDIIIGNELWDFKTCKSADERDINKEIWSRGLYIQAAWYLRGARENGMDVTDFGFCFVEKTPPFAGRLVKLDPGYLAIGEATATRLLLEYADCKAVDMWPGYDNIKVEVPAWA